MKSLLIAAFVAAGLMLGGAANASEAKANAAGCLKCHGIDKKKMGSALKDISAKYKGNRDAAATLTAKLKEAAGHPKSTASDEDLKAIVNWMLAL